MRRLLLCRVIACCAIVVAGSVGAAGASPLGGWRRDDGRGGIRITTCGPALCGYVTWLRDADSPARVGERVLYDMRQVAADSWAGSAHNPEDGREYDGTLTLDGDRLITRGCLAGFICRTIVLLRE